MDENLGLGVQGVHIYVHCIPLMPDSLSLVWSHPVHFAHAISDSTILETLTTSVSFHQISNKLHTKYHNQGVIYAITFLAI